MGKASDLVRKLEAAGPRAAPARPELKIRDDAPSVVITPEASVEALFDSMRGEQVVIRDAGGTPKAVVLSPERYAELAGSEIHANELLEGTLKGKVQPTPEALGRLMVEQVDQTQEWPIGSSRGH